MSRRSGIFSPLFRVATGLAATAALEVANPLVAAAAVAPSKPLAVTASPGDTAARVTWSAPASDGGATITAYKAIASPGGRSCTIGGTDLSCLVRGLADGTAYSFKVKAQTEAGWGKSSTPSLAVVPVHHTAAYLGSQGKKFYAVGLSDHSQLWSQSPSADVNAVALVSGTTLFWGDDANTLHAVDLADPGHPELWTYTASLCFQEQGMAVSGTTLLPSRRMASSMPSTSRRGSSSGPSRPVDNSGSRTSWLTAAGTSMWLAPTLSSIGSMWRQGWSRVLFPPALRLTQPWRSQAGMC